jgi:hypothetical protein
MRNSPIASNPGTTAGGYSVTSAEGGARGISGGGAGSGAVRSPANIDGGVATGIQIGEPRDASEFEFATKPWFALVSGLASVLGLLVALYSVPASNMPPSEYKALLWRKSLYTSLGVGMIVFSTIQLYQQPDPPAFLFGVFYNFLHGIPPEYTGGYFGTWIWGILFVIGLIIFVWGISGRAQEQIRRRVIDEFVAIQRSEGEATNKFLCGRAFSELADDEQMNYQEMKGFYRLLRYSTIEMLTGSQFTRAMKYNDAAILGGRIEDALSVLETASKLVQSAK